MFPLEAVHEAATGFGCQEWEHMRENRDGLCEGLRMKMLPVLGICAVTNHFLNYMCMGARGVGFLELKWQIVVC